MSAIAEDNFIDSRRRIIDAAAEAFCEEGYRASIERIAAKAGVARQTLYNHFPSKDDLFAEVVRRGSAAILVSLDGEANVRDSLLRFGAAFRNKVLGAEGIAYFRALIAEAMRFPGLAKSFYQNGPARMTAMLADFLARAMSKGSLRQGDPEFAADMLLGMLNNSERTQRLCGDPPLSTEQESARVVRIIDCFLTAFGPERNSA
jgi:TetR/AcrR family transcriptional repressor of mexJK operon